jgi:DNA polymerase-4
MTFQASKRKIIHVDMDAFYASVEQRDFPEYKGKPLVVGGSPEGRGVVASASYEARAFGIRSAMSAAQAKRLCPHAIFVYPRFEAYKEVSDRIREIFHEVTDLVEPLSLDEAYLDVTENKMNEPLAGKLAIWIRKEIERRLSLTASAGVASTLFLAKIASDLKKPNGLTIIPPDQVLDFISKLPVSKLWGVGPATESVLHKLGIKEIQDLRNYPTEKIQKELGKQGLFLQRLSMGIDERTVEPDWERKSYGSERTFLKDVTSLLELDSVLRELCIEISDSLKIESKRGRSLTLKVRYSDFSTITRSVTLHRFFDEGEKFFSEVQALLHEKTEAGVRPVRLIGISVSQLIHNGDPEQLWFDLPEFN